MNIDDKENKYKQLYDLCVEVRNIERELSDITNFEGKIINVKSELNSCREHYVRVSKYKEFMLSELKEKIKEIKSLESAR